MTRKLHWVGPVGDSSGYANATRNYIASILNVGRLDLSVETISFEQIKTVHRLLPMIQPHIKPNTGAGVQVIHLTPENYSKYYNPDCYNIAYTTWEADPLPPSWIPEINRMQEVWVPSSWNVDVFKRSGVVPPVLRVPHAITVSEEPVEFPPYPGDTAGLFWFYSIFQWIARKNPRSLLIAYFTEFMAEEPVVLALKTYRQNTSPKEVAIIKQEVAQVKQFLNLQSYPKILLFSNLLSSIEMRQLHNRGDCFVLPSRGEGFSITHATAMAYGKPVISSNYGGPSDYITKENGFLIPCRETPVSGMDWMHHYTGRMVWGEPDIMKLRKVMRWVFSHQEEARKIGEEAKKDITRDFSYATIGDMISTRVEKIYQKLEKKKKE